MVNDPPRDILPHRPPFLFIDEVIECDQTRVLAVRTFRAEEDFFRGHFPDRPIVPGVLIMEALAQLSGLVAIFGGHSGEGIDGTAGAESSADCIMGRLAHMECRFHRAVTPPAEIRLRSKQHGVFEKLYQYEVEAAVGDAVVAKGRLTLALTPRQGSPDCRVHH